MAKTYRHLFERVIAFESLHAAYRRARRGKRSQSAVLRFEQDLEGELWRLRDELADGRYRPGDYRTFYVTEPKSRLISAIPFRDRVVQHALVAVIEPIWEREFIAHSYACRVGKGTHAAVDQVERWVRQVQRACGQAYVLKADVAGYFASIDHDVLMGLLRRRIGCPRTLALCRSIVDSWSPGLPIGNLTSQLWANVYLHELDRFAKQARRARYYARYMDDVVIVSGDKAQLHAYRRAIEDWVSDRLRLRLNRKTQVFPVGRHGRALDWLGYRLWPTHRRLRRESVRRMERRLRYLGQAYACGHLTLSAISARVQSWVAHAGHARSWRIREQVLGRVRL